MIDQAPGDTPYATLYPCPISTCDWVHEEQHVEVRQGALASVFGMGTMAAVAAFQKSAKVELVLATHLGSHGVAEWVAEVNRRETDTKNRVLKRVSEMWDPQTPGARDEMLKIIEEA